jgi:putative tryptophan/tyrosine transport system substrate-binding protein
VRRRELITLLGGAAIMWPLAARAQQSPKLPTIGFLGPNTSSLDSNRVSAFVQRLRELGWIEGRTVAIEYRWAEGRIEHLAEFAAEFVRLKVDVIVTSGTPPVVAAKQATSVIPIVFAAVGGPGRQRLGRKSAATGRQRYRIVNSSNRSCWQASWTVARGYPRVAQLGDHGQQRRSARSGGDAGG